MNYPPNPILTAREIEVLVQLANGFANKQIVKQLCISENTVEFHLKNIYRKLGFHSRTDATRWYWQDFSDKDYGNP